MPAQKQFNIIQLKLNSVQSYFALRALEEAKATVESTEFANNSLVTKEYMLGIYDDIIKQLTDLRTQKGL